MSALSVYLHGRLVGALVRKQNGNLQFRYDHDYLADGGGALSLNLPVRREAYGHRDSLAFFSNLLPEQDVRTQLAKAVGISEANDYRLLERFGGDVAGAVTLRSTDQEEGEEEGEAEELGASRLDEILTNLPERPLAADENDKIRLSLAGAQSKLPVVKAEEAFALPVGTHLPTTHILKPEPARFPGLVANEFYCMRLADHLGLPTAKVDYERTDSGLPFLVVERYDRDLTQEPIRRLHQEDLCQALGRLPDEKYQKEDGPTVAEAIALIDRGSSAPARDRPAFWSALVFNVLIGNCDAHGKNYSLLYDSAAPSLAPLYDLVSTAVYESLTTTLAMSVNGASDLGEVNRKAWDRLAVQAGIAPRYVEQRLKPFVNSVVAGARVVAQRAEHDDAVVKDILSGIEERAQRIVE